MYDRKRTGHRCMLLIVVSACCVVSQLAAIQVQRVWRGHIGRERFKRKVAWRETPPGPERLQLGLKIIASSKDAYDRQKSEVEVLQRAHVRLCPCLRIAHKNNQ